MDEALRRKLESIELLILDVDGVLTDGGLYYSESGEMMKKFFVRDGLGIKLLQLAGIRIAFITGLRSKLVENRARDLGIDLIEQDCMAKLPAAQRILQRLDLDWSQVAFIGDDLIDVPLMRRAGFAAAVADAPEGVKQTANYITRQPGGNGAVREVCDLILKAVRQVDPDEIYTELTKDFSKD